MSKHKREDQNLETEKPVMDEPVLGTHPPPKPPPQRKSRVGEYDRPPPPLPGDPQPYPEDP